MCIDDTENHTSQTSTLRFDVSSKGGYGRWWAMTDVIGRWIRARGRGGGKMEDGDGGRTDHPAESSHGFPFQNRTKSIFFLMYLGISSTLLSVPPIQTGQNNTRIIPLGSTLNSLKMNCLIFRSTYRSTIARVRIPGS